MMKEKNGMEENCDHESGQKCHHENVTQLNLLDITYPAVHGPSTEVWWVKCDDCGKKFKDSFIGN